MTPRCRGSIVLAEGEHLGTISTGEVTANVGWGGAVPGDRCGNKTLSMTASTSLYSIDVRTGGCSPGKLRGRGTDT